MVSKKLPYSGAIRSIPIIFIHFYFQVGFVIHNLPVIAKMAAVGKACGHTWQKSRNPGILDPLMSIWGQPRVALYIWTYLVKFWLI